MATRQYGQYCAIAKALDVLGDRWALLIVRELLFGAMRYGELQTALPGVATDMLAIRLRELEIAGVVARDAGGTKRYELTARGRALRPVLETLAVWGLGELTERAPDEAFDAKWMALPLAGMVRVDRALGLTIAVKLVFDGDEVTVRIEDGVVTFPANEATADVVIAGPPDALAAASAGITTAAGQLEIRGDRVHIEQLLYVLGLRDTPLRGKTRKTKANPAQQAAR